MRKSTDEKLKTKKEQTHPSLFSPESIHKHVERTSKTSTKVPHVCEKEGKKAEFLHFTLFGMFYNISNISIQQTPCDICIYVTAIWKYEDINSELPASTFQRKQTPQE